MCALWSVDGAVSSNCDLKYLSSTFGYNLVLYATCLHNEVAQRGLISTDYGKTRDYVSLILLSIHKTLAKITNLLL